MDDIIKVNKGKNNFDNTKLLAFLSVLSIIIGVIVFGYVVVGTKYKFRESPKKDNKDFSISYTLANGFIPGIVIFIFLSGLFIFRLLYIRHSNKFYYLRYLLIFLVVTIMISLIWVTPLNYDKSDNYTKDEENVLMGSHAILAFIAFTSATIFVLLTYRIFYLNYRDKLFIGLSFISIISYFILISAAVISFMLGKNRKIIRDSSYVFDAFELINASLLCLSILIYGFYGLKSLKKN